MELNIGDIMRPSEKMDGLFHELQALLSKHKASIYAGFDGLYIDCGSEHFKALHVSELEIKVQLRTVDVIDDYGDPIYVDSRKRRYVNGTISEF